MQTNPKISNFLVENSEISRTSILTTEPVEKSTNELDETPFNLFTQTFKSSDNFLLPLPPQRLTSADPFKKLTSMCPNLLLVEDTSNETLGKPLNAFPWTGNDSQTLSYSMVKSSETPALTFPTINAHCSSLLPTSSSESFDSFNPTNFPPLNMSLELPPLSNSSSSTSDDLPVLDFFNPTNDHFAHDPFRPMKSTSPLSLNVAQCWVPTEDGGKSSLSKSATKADNRRHPLPSTSSHQRPPCILTALDKEEPPQTPT